MAGTRHPSSIAHASLRSIRALGSIAAITAVLCACSGRSDSGPGSHSTSQSSGSGAPDSGTQGEADAQQTTGGPGCTTTNKVSCDPTGAKAIDPGPPVTVAMGAGAIPEAFGGVVTPGSYVLIGVTTYGPAAPDVLSLSSGTQETGTMTVFCDQYNQLTSATGPTFSGGGNGCGRLVPSERPLSQVVLSNDPTTDGTPYNATSDTIDLIEIQPFWSGAAAVLGASAVVSHYALVASAADMPLPLPDASTPLPAGRDPRCPASAPDAGGASCDPSAGPLECEYGGDAYGRCTTLATCALPYGGSSFAFTVTQSSDCGTNDPSCPSSFQAAQALGPLVIPTDGGANPACLPDGGGVVPAVACNYAEGACDCTTWSGNTNCSCAARGGVQGANGVTCPAQRPLAGDACTTEGLYCGYAPLCGGVSLGPSMACIDGHWIQYSESAGCPATVGCPVPASP